MLRVLKRAATVAALIAVPTLASAQAVLTGTVKDNSGAVLPGVTVEAASPALIEKTKTAVTDGTGQYRIIDLRPGTYTLTFTLAGFNTVKRENIELVGSQTLSIPVQMSVGGVQETITVTGEAPVVDVQNARRELVMNKDVIESLPAARAAGALLNATPGLSVGGSAQALSPTMTFFNAHSSTENSRSVAGEGRMAVSGMTVAAARSGGVSSYVYDTPNAQEVAITVGGGLGENDIGGPVMNIIPRSGGNTFAGSAFLNLAGDWSRSDNLNDELRAIGLTQTPGVIHSHDGSASFGGPIKRDHLWFYGSYRSLDTQTAVEGVTANSYAGDASHWDWAGSPINTRLVQDRQMIIGRFTGQVGASRIQFNSEYQHRCEGTPLEVDTPGCHNRGDDWIGLGDSSSSPEATGSASRGYFDWPYYLNQAQWTMPASNKLLLEANVTIFSYNPAFGYPPPDGITDLIPVTEQSSAINPSTGLPYAPRANYKYRGMEQWGYAVGKTQGWTASASYVTGANSLKVGYQGNREDQEDQTLTNQSQMAYRFNRGVPNRVTYRLPDFGHRTITNLESVYIQDSWTRDRLTLQGALRYDRVSSYAPVDRNGTTKTSFLNPTPISFPKLSGVDAFNDLTPRVGIAYDVFGNGKTALKFRWGHYLGYAANDAPYTSNNPAATVVSSVNRNWDDADHDYAVDCDLLNTAANGECAALTGNSANFGQPGAATIVDPDVLHGWGKRPNDYQTTFTVQQQIVPRVSADFSYTYRTFHGFLVTYDTTRDPATDYETYTLTAPTDSRLPNGGGYPITLYVPTAAAVATPTQNRLTWDSSFGPERDSHWNGFDITLNARLHNGLTTSFGTSTGRSIVDDCATVVKYNSGDPRGCHSVQPYQTTVRGLASYTVPKIDVLVSTVIRSEAALQLTANWRVPNSVVKAALGHLPPGTFSSGNTTVALTDNENRLYVDNRRTQVDMRFAKVLRFGGTRAEIGVDLNNLLNTNYATRYNTTYSYADPNGGDWGQPTSVYAPRFVRLNFTVDF
jgi:hypothetical protein